MLENDWKTSKMLKKLIEIIFQKTHSEEWGDSNLKWIMHKGAQVSDQEDQNSKWGVEAEDQARATTRPKLSSKEISGEPFRG